MYFKWINPDKNFKKTIKLGDKNYKIVITVILPKLKISTDVFKTLNFFVISSLKKIIIDNIYFLLKFSPILLSFNPKYEKVNKKYLSGIMLLILGASFIFLPVIKNNFSIKKNKNLSIINNKKITVEKVSAFSSNSEIKIKGENITIKKDANLPKLIPDKIIIPKIGVDLIVEPSEIKEGYFEVSEKNASWGKGSAGVGEKGNMVIFAHARDELFGPLVNLKEKDVIYIFSKEKWYKYEVKEIKTVNPIETEVIAPTKDETLTLYTCIGFLDNQRLIIIAKLKLS